MATFASFLSCSSPPFLPSLRRGVLPAVSFSVSNPSRNFNFSRIAFRVFASSPSSPFSDWEFSNDDENSKSTDPRTFLFRVIRDIEPLDVSVIQKDVPPTTIDAMKRTISGMLGLLPSDQFEVTIEALWGPLFKLLMSSMMTGYTLRNAEYRLILERNLEICGENKDTNTKDSKVEAKGTHLEDKGIRGNDGQESSPASDESEETTYNIPDFGGMTPEAKRYILQLHTNLSSVKKELHEVKRKNAALQMQQFVGEEKNDLLDYLRSLQPEQVAELSEALTPELDDIIHSVVHGLLATLSPKMYSKGPNLGDNGTVGTVEFENAVDINTIENTSLNFRPIISLQRDYLARLLFWCMLLGHYLRGLEYRVELMDLLSLPCAEKS